MNKLLSPPRIEYRQERDFAGLHSNRLSHSRFLIVLICFTVLASYTLARWQSTCGHPFRKIQLSGQWIQAPEDATSSYFRKRFELNGPIRNAWIMVAAKEGFELSINKNPIGRQYLGDPLALFKQVQVKKANASFLTIPPWL